MEGKHIKKILLTSDTVGGVWNFSIDLCKYLKNEGISVILAVTGEPLSEYQQIEINSLDNVTLQYKKLKLEWMENPQSDIDYSIKWISYLIHLFKPDLLHFNSFSFARANYNLPVVVTAHSDVFSWYDAVMHKKPHSAWNDYFFNVKDGLNKADTITAPSYYMKNYIERIYNIKSKVTVIYNGRDSKSFVRRTKENYIFSIGRIWDEAKNYDTLFEAANEILIPIYIAGEYDDKINHSTFPPHLNLLGKIPNEDVAKYLSKALIFVHTAKYEPFGLAPLEAALSKCVLVLNDIPSLREIWQDNALFFSNKNELVFTINDLLSNQVRYKTYSEKAYRHALKFSLERMGDNYLNIYKQLVKENVIL